MDLSGIGVPVDATVYPCGPLPSRRAVRGGLPGAGVPARSLHHEVFGPDLWPPEAA